MIAEKLKSIRLEDKFGVYCYAMVVVVAGVMGVILWIGLLFSNLFTYNSILTIGTLAAASSIVMCIINASSGYYEETKEDVEAMDSSELKKCFRCDSFIVVGAVCLFVSAAVVAIIRLLSRKAYSYSSPSSPSPLSPPPPTIPHSSFLIPHC